MVSFSFHSLIIIFWINMCKAKKKIEIKIKTNRGLKWNARKTIHVIKKRRE